MFEKLEKRQLMSSVLQAGVLTVTGTGSSEVIHVLRSGNNTTVIQTNQPNVTYQTPNILKVVVNANGGNDRVDCSTDLVPVEIHGGSGNDTLIGGSNNDDIFGDDGNDQLRGEGGEDALHGGKGNDDLDGGLGNDFLDGQSGSDTADYSLRNVPVNATIELDGTSPSGGQNHFNQSGFGGQAGEKDTYEGVENLAGGAKSDVLKFLGPAIIDSDLPAPKLGDYSLMGNGGNDNLSTDGTSFFDDSHVHVSLSGGNGNDLISDNPAYIRAFEFGGAGNDTFAADEQEDPGLPGPRVVDAGSGTDLEILGTSDVASVTLGTNLENFKVRTGTSIVESFSVTGNSLDNVIDLSGADVIGPNTTGVVVNGGDGDDSILGSNSDDTLNGGSGNDTIHGNAGKDSITGGNGHDKLFGDAGNDSLFASDSSKDTLDGGSGVDKAKRDVGLDVVTNVETFI